MELKHIKADGTYKIEIINEEKKVCNKSVTNQIFGGSTGLLKNYSWKNLNGRNVHAFVVKIWKFLLRWKCGSSIIKNGTKFTSYGE